MMKTNNLLGVNKSNAIIYIIFFIIGLLLLFISLLLRNYDNSIAVFFYDCMVCLGCGFITAVLIAYFIDLSNQSRSKANKKYLRELLLWGIPHGTFFVARKTIEFFLSEKESGKPLKDAFYAAVDDMSNILPSEDHNEFERYIRTREEFIKNIGYGISLFVRDAKKIDENKDYYLINDIFTEKEILAIDYTCDELGNILNMHRIDEIAEYLKLAIEEMFNKIPEVNRIFSKEVTYLKNGAISNEIEFLRNE